MAFTAHHVIAAPVDPAEVHAHLDPDDLGSPMKPAFLAWLGERLGSAPGMLDVVLAAAGGRGTGAVLRPAPHLEDHPRARRAVQYRTDVRVYADRDESGILVVGSGLAGRAEVAVELAAGARGRGLGTRMLAAARTLVEPGEVLFAQAPPGNAASLRALLAAGFHPIGGEVLYLHGDGERGSPRLGGR